MEKNPSANISLARAFKHCASTTSYWIWLIILGIVSIGGAIFIIINSQTNGWQSGHQWGMGGCAVVLACAILMRPVEVAANTTNEQADRGVFIGY